MVVMKDKPKPQHGPCEDQVSSSDSLKSEEQSVSQTSDQKQQEIKEKLAEFIKSKKDKFGKRQTISIDFVKKKSTMEIAQKKTKEKKEKHTHEEHDHDHESIVPVARIMQSVFCLIQPNDDLVITDTIFYVSQVIITQIEKEMGEKARDVFMQNFVNEYLLKILHQVLGSGNEMIVLQALKVMNYIFKNENFRKIANDPSNTEKLIKKASTRRHMSFNEEVK